jgi:hypothetical protein
MLVCRSRFGVRQVSRLAVGLLAVGCCLATLLAVGWAGEPVTRPAKVTTRSASNATADKSSADGTSPAADSVEMFAAMKSGDIAVKFIPKDDREARVMFTNKTRRPLSVQLPAAFAAVPVLAQRGGGGGGGGMGGMGGGMMGGMNQMMGGGMGGMGGGMGGGMMGGMGGGMMNVPAEKLDDGISITLGAGKGASYKIATVCLEHGKRDPRAAIPYEIRPLETVMTKPGVAELLTLLGYGRIDQRGAQAAAWHLANGMSWEQLSQKRVQTVLGDGGSYFTPDQITIGVNIAQVAVTAAANRLTPNSADKKSPGDAVNSDSSSTDGRQAPAR